MSARTTTIQCCIAGGGPAGIMLGYLLVVRMLDEFPELRRIPARLIGLGVRPEHVPVM